MLLVAAAVSLVIVFWEQLKEHTRDVLNFCTHQNKFRIFILAVCIIIGLFHASQGKASNAHLYFFRMLGPFLASPLTCLTYGVIINSSFSLMFLVLYDQSTLQRYEGLDVVTILITMLIVVSWAVMGIFTLIVETVLKESNQYKAEIAPVPAQHPNMQQSVEGEQ
jgi:hypothetical protein